MECEECRDLLCDFAAGELAGDQARQIRAHADSCPRCAREIERFAGALGALRSAGADAPAADRAFLRRLGKRLDEVDFRMGRRSEPLFRWHFVGGVAAAAAAVLVLANVLLPWPGGGAVEDPAEPGPLARAGGPESPGARQYLFVTPVEYRPAFSTGGEGAAFPAIGPESLALRTGPGGNTFFGHYVDMEEHRRLKRQVEELNATVEELRAKLTALEGAGESNRAE